MLFSICIPVYNTAQYLERCLHSILAQHGVEFEIILLNDGSTDTSGTICDRYAMQYPHIRVIHKENEGLLATRRRGFLESRGDWFICVDSDDFIKEGHLQAIANTILEYDCDLVMFDYESVYPDGHTESSGINIADTCVYEGVGKQELYKNRLLKNKFNNMWSKAIKRSVLDFDTDYSIFGIRNMCEDAIQCYELYTRAKKIVYIPQALYFYCRNIVSISTSITMDYWYAILTSNELGWKYAQLWDVPKNIMFAYGSRCISSYCDFLAWFLLIADEVDSQRETVFQNVFLNNPWFFLSAKYYKRKYLATKYLKIRNPLIVDSIRAFHTYSIAQQILRLEQLLRRT